MRALRRSVFVSLALLAASLALVARPNFSGSWKMNAEKSDFGNIPAPTKFERTIQHTDPDISFKTVQAGQMGEITTDLKYTTDGKECTNTIRGSEVKGTARWDGDILVIDSKREIQGTVLTQSDRWTLDEDGKTIHIQSTIGTPQGNLDIKLVLEKQ